VCERPDGDEVHAQLSVGLNDRPAADTGSHLVPAGRSELRRY
jgi:hypothetical protein